MGIPLAATLWLLVYDSRQRWSITLLLETGMVALAGIWLIDGYGVSRLSSIGTESAVFDARVQPFLSSPFKFISTLPLLKIISEALSQVHLTPALMLVLLAGGLIASWRQSAGWQKALIIGLVMFYSGWCLLVPLYLEQPILLTRYVTSISPIGALLAAWAITSIVLWIAAVIFGSGAARCAPTTWRMGFGRPISHVLAGVLVIVWLLPHYGDVYARARELSLRSDFDDYLL